MIESFKPLKYQVVCKLVNNFILNIFFLLLFEAVSFDVYSSTVFRWCALICKYFSFHCPKTYFELYIIAYYFNHIVQGIANVVVRVKWVYSPFWAK